MNVGDVQGDHARVQVSGSGVLQAVKGALVAHGGGSGGIRVYGQPVQSSISGKGVQSLD